MSGTSSSSTPREVVGDDGAEQQPAEARRGVDRQHQVPERDPPGRGDGPGVPHLQLGQHHVGQ